MASDNGNSDDEVAGEVADGGNGKPSREVPMSILSTGRFVRAAKWLASWKGLLALALTVGGGAGAWAVRAYLDRHDATAHAPIMVEIRELRSDVAAVKVSIAGIDGSLRVLIPQAATRPPLPPPPPAPVRAASK